MMNWSKTYDLGALRDFDKITDFLMRAGSIQGAVNAVMPAEPPRNRYEYEQAARVFYGRIIEAQPDINDDYAPPHIAYRVAPGSIHPLGLISHHLHVAILSLALGAYVNGITMVLGMQETAKQFGHDDFLTVAAKLGFGVWALAIRREQRLDLVARTAGLCQKAVHGKEELSSATHSKSALDLCGQLYVIAGVVANMKDPSSEDPFGFVAPLKRIYGPRPDREELRLGLKIVLDGYSATFDKRTSNRFRIQEWVDETLKDLDIYVSN